MLDPPAHAGQHSREATEPVILRRVMHLAPARVVAILLAPARVSTGGQDVPVRARADPHLGPGRRNPDRLDQGPLIGIRDDAAIRSPVNPAVLSPLPGD